MEGILSKGRISMTRPRIEPQTCHSIAQNQIHIVTEITGQAPPMYGYIKILHDTITVIQLCKNAEIVS